MARRVMPRPATCPVWLMCGRQDPWTTLAAHEAMRADCPTASLTVLETCGHMAPMEQPEAVTRWLHDWLRV